ncbi:unnamed protein product [Adineta steineri]|uniref:Nuclear receptor domain-containing protein n=1 Tax=Adineta steineri TaxID=433720 RepID=A0A819D3A9_9BILA|nr:unnamed protein product [Adineta steineri]
MLPMYSNSNDYDDISLDASNISDSLPVKLSKRNNGRNCCAICGAKSTGNNFDVLTCSSCKAFFRRNGIKPLNQFFCHVSGNCKIDERTRRQCTACRLRKCFAMGMVKERIRTEEQNQRHRALVEANRRQKLKQSDQLQKHSQKISKIHHDSISSMDSDTNQVDLLFELFYDNAQQIISDDFIFKFDRDLTDVLNLYCVPVSCLITFLKQLSQFQQLSIDDRLILLKYNTKVLIPILIYLLNTTFDIQILINHPGICNINNKIADAYSLFSNIVPDDNRLLVILIIVLLFCPCLYTTDSLYDVGYISDHSRQLIQYAYDEYVQLLWYYVVEKCDDNEQQAALMYMKIVTACLQLQKVTNEIYDIVKCFVQIDQLHMMMQSILHLT